MSDEIHDQSGVLWMVQPWFPINLGFCPSQEIWDKWMKRCGITGQDAIYPELDRRTGGTFSWFAPDDHDNYVPFGLITIGPDAEKRDPSVVTGMLVHESVHAFQYVLRRMNEKGMPGSEFEAYSIQAIYMFMENAFSETRWDVYHGKKKDDASKPDRASAKKVRTKIGKGVPAVDTADKPRRGAGKNHKRVAARRR